MGVQETGFPSVQAQDQGDPVGLLSGGGEQVFLCASSSLQMKGFISPDLKASTMP
jgi:hypothetical protein